MAKISELQKISTVVLKDKKAIREIALPLSFQKENRHITVGQIIETVPQMIVPFDEIREPTGTVTVAPGGGTAVLGDVVFDTQTCKFYLAQSVFDMDSSDKLTTYYQTWTNSDAYYNEQGEVRQDCIFRAADGNMYFFNGSTLKMAGIGKPIEITDESAMEALIERGEAVDGQIYFIAEE